MLKDNAINLFIYPPPYNSLRNINKNSIKLKKPKYNKIKEALIDTHNFKLNQVNKYINIIKKTYNDLNNTNESKLKLDNVVIDVS